MAVSPICPLQVRILFHVSQKKKDETTLMQYHERLGESVVDQLSLASFHYLQANYQDATDIYKRVLLEHRDWLALNVYVALCYYNLDFHDVSLEILNAYPHAFPASTVAANLKVLPRLQDIFPEAQLNLAIYHLCNNELQQAYEVVSKLDISSPQEYIIKAVTCACLGQKISSEDLIQQAQQLFQLVGSSVSEWDTIPGRQSMASFYFSNKQFEDALIYLKSIKKFCGTMDEFKWNYGIARASVGDYAYFS